jgi:hypothetical protein
MKTNEDVQCISTKIAREAARTASNPSSCTPTWARAHGSHIWTHENKQDRAQMMVGAAMVVIGTPMVPMVIVGATP